MIIENKFSNEVDNEYIALKYPNQSVICVIISVPEDIDEYCEKTKDFFKDIPQFEFANTEDYVFMIFDDFEEALYVWNKIPYKGYYYATLYRNGVLASENV